MPAIRFCRLRRQSRRRSTLQPSLAPAVRTSFAREAFAGVDPANTTYYVGGLIPEGALVEVELDAIVEPR